MPLTFDEDGLAAILADDAGFGDDVMFGKTPFRGIFSREQRLQDDGTGSMGAVLWVTTLLVQASALPSTVTEDSVLVIGGANYRVRRIGPVNAGGARELHLAEG